MINESLVNVARHADVRISVLRWQQDFLREQYDIETVHIPKIALNGGKYSLTVNVTSPENLGTYLKVENAASLNVHMHFFSAANIVLPVNWTTTS